jgi:uncharacterized YigZ family protein
MDARYLTIKSAVEGLYKEKGSKFLSFAYPVSTEDEIKSRIHALEKQYFDARHHCYAWVLGAEKKNFRTNDDGEPNHSAGDPIMGQIKSNNLTNVLVVVVRYFGGVKLGVGGLVTAYKTAAADALSRAEIIEKEVREMLKLEFDYAFTAEVMRLIKDYDMEIIDESFAENCVMNVTIYVGVRKELEQRLNIFHATGIDIHYVFYDN